MSEMSAGALAELGRALTESDRSGRSSEHSGVVLRVDASGTPWVRIYGGSEECPIKETTAEVAPGMVVKVTISGGKARITGSTSAPSMSAQKANEMMIPIADAAQKATALAIEAQDAAESAAISAAEASNSADIAQEAAEQAVEDAQTATQAAATASQKADAASASAANALNQAVAAQTSATQANAYAIAGLHGLSEVESVLGTLDWIAEHGRYILTADEAVVPNKVYYTLTGGVFSPTTDTAIVTGKQYYTQSVDYVPSTDSVVDSGKTYYEYDDVQDLYVAVTPTGEENPSEEGWFEQSVSYHPVASPDVSEISSYYEVSGASYSAVENPVESGLAEYYELVVDESVQNYIASHLAQTDNGLDLMVDGTAFRMHIGTVDGTMPLGTYIIGADGVPAAQFTATSTVIGKPTGAMHVELTPNKLSFVDAVGNEAAYIETSPDTGFSVMYITRSVVVEDMQFGKWKWYSRANGNMALKWVG